MDAIDRMQLFTRVAELASFTQAADSVGLPKATVSTAIQQLENQMGARLLHRTTRRVQLTQDGQAFYERAKDLLADMEELQAMFRQGDAQALVGRVRIDMSTGFARNVVVPRLPELLKLHPLLELELSSTERRVDLVREGFDCVVRTGAVVDAGLVARPLGEVRLLNCASPGYLQEHGMPKTPADLATHRLVHFSGTLGARSTGFEYVEAGQDRRVAMQGSVTVNNAEAYTSACLSGLGLIQVPAIGVDDTLAQGRLVEVLPEFQARPMAVTLLYPHRRNLSMRVRIVMDWLAGVISGHLRQYTQ